MRTSPGVQRNVRAARVVAFAAMGGFLGAAADAAWEVETRTDPMDDSSVLEISTMSQEPLTCGPQQPLRLALICDSDGTHLRFEHGCYMPGDYGRVEMDWRLGNQPVGGVRFYVSDPSDWFGYFGEGHHTALMLMEVDRLALRFTPAGEAEQTVSFDLSGLDEAIAPLREACGW